AQMQASRAREDRTQGRLEMKLICGVLCTAVCSYALVDGHFEVRDPGVRQGAAGATGAVTGVDPDYFDNLQAAFKEVYSIAGDIESGAGLGPRYNGTGC